MRVLTIVTHPSECDDLHDCLYGEQECEGHVEVPQDVLIRRRHVVELHHEHESVQHNKSHDHVLEHTAHHYLPHFVTEAVLVTRHVAF